ncbi:hypothetical protein KIW84_066043 [Lathyrus oleraceus]|uniref:Uncharacterized protein n=1 Tax=Pisum sativum TaxID=3888 RepID=A0A9D5AB25_PEA|nr:hypothetical protein KIW84_066043 [Pisum sativum]
MNCVVLVEFQQLLQLLLKASQDKRFVCEEAERALGSMVGSMTPLPLLQKLRVSVSHKNLRIRAKAAVSLYKCVSKMVNEEMEEFGMEKLIEVATDLVNDRLPEARDAARSIATSVYEAIIKDVEVEEKMEVFAHVPGLMHPWIACTKNFWSHELVSIPISYARWIDALYFHDVGFVAILTAAANMTGSMSIAALQHANAHGQLWLVGCLAVLTVLGCMVTFMTWHSILVLCGLHCFDALLNVYSTGLRKLANCYALCRYGSILQQVHDLKACSNSDLATGSAATCLQSGLVNQDMVICKAFVVLQHVQCFILVYDVLLSIFLLLQELLNNSGLTAVELLAKALAKAKDKVDGVQGLALTADGQGAVF